MCFKDIAIRIRYRINRHVIIITYYSNHLNCSITCRALYIIQRWEGDNYLKEKKIYLSYPTVIFVAYNSLILAGLLYRLCIKNI